MNFLGRINGIFAYRHGLWGMAVKQLKAKYAGSLLGIAGAILNPLLVTLAITFVFAVVFKVEMKNFSFFVLSGMFPWMFFAAALSEGAFSILGQQNILRQFSLPREILPLACVLSNFLNYLIGWLIIFPLFVFLNPKIIVLFPFFVYILLANLFFVWGLGLILSVANVFFRDIGNLLGVLLMLWLWVTPVFYSQEMIPKSFRWVCDFNPMTSFIVYYHDVVFRGLAPGFSLMANVFFSAAITFALGLWVFSRLEPYLLKRI